MDILTGMTKKHFKLKMSQKELMSYLFYYKNLETQRLSIKIIFPYVYSLLNLFLSILTSAFLSYPHFPRLV